MDANRFDALIRSLSIAIPRRVAVGSVLGAGVPGILGGMEAIETGAKKKKKKKCKNGKKKCGKKCFDLKNDPAHCGSCNTVCGTGEACFDGQCLTGIGTCSVGDDFCLSVQDVCNDNDTCQCLQSFTGETRCGSFPVPPFVCGECTTDAECANRGPGAFCAKDTGAQCVCAVGQGFCMIPCVFDANGN